MIQIGEVCNTQHIQHKRIYGHYSLTRSTIYGATTYPTMPVIPQRPSAVLRTMVGNISTENRTMVA